MFSLAVLGLLFVLVIAFLQTTALERQAAANLVEQARADGVARAGVHWTVGQLQGQALDRAHDGPLVGAVREEWSIIPGGTSTFPAATGGPHGLELIDAGEVAWDTPFTPGGQLATAFTNAGVDQRKSASVGGSFVEEGDFFMVKVLDTAGQLNLNGRQDPQILASMLNVLGQDIADLFGTDPIAGNGGDIVTFRDALPNSSFEQKAQLFDAFMSITANDQAASQARFDLVKDFVAVHGWRDLAASKPENVSASATDVPRDQVYDTEPRGRYPININTAPRPVLVAMIANLTGRKLSVNNSGTVAEVSNADPTAQGPAGQFPTVAGLVDTAAVLERVDVGSVITVAEARTLAAALITAREAAAFRSFNEVRQFLTDNVAGGFTQDEADVVFASLLPSAIVNDLNPDRVIRDLVVQKSNVGYVAGTTFVPDSTAEACFSSMGFYEIQSIGRVAQADGVIAAEGEVTVVAKIFDVVRHSSQRDFVAGAHLGTSSTPSANQGAMTTLLFPEPISDPDVQPSPAMGFMTALPIESTPLIGGATFQHTFNDGLAPTLSSGGQVTGYTADKTEGHVLTAEMGDVAPDGVMNWRAGSRVRSLGYPSAGHVDGSEGSLEFFVKLATDAADGTDEVLMFSNVPVTGAPPAGSTSEGIAWRLERFGGLLVSSRFYYTFPTLGNEPGKHPRIPDPIPFDFADETTINDPTINPLVFTEIQTDISDWKAGEWHHVAVEWFDTTGHSVGPDVPVLQSLYIDGQQVGSFDPTTNAALGGGFGVRAVELEESVTTRLDEFFSTETSNSTDTISIDFDGFDFSGTNEIIDNGFFSSGPGPDGIFGTIDDVKGTLGDGNNVNFKVLADGTVEIFADTVDDVKGDKFTFEFTQNVITTTSVTTEVTVTITTRTFTNMLFKLRSHDEFGPSGAGIFEIGGYESTPIENVNLFRLGIETGAGLRQRFSNATIDDVVAYDARQDFEVNADEATHGRYDLLTFPATFSGRMRVPTDSRVGTVTATVFYAAPGDDGGAPPGLTTTLQMNAGYGVAAGDVPTMDGGGGGLTGQAFSPNIDPSIVDLGVRFRQNGFNGAPIDNAATGSVGQNPIATTGELFYGFEFQGIGPAAYWNQNSHETPFALLDVTATVIGEPVFLDRR